MKTKIKNAIIAAALIISVSACNEDETKFLIPKGEENEVQIENSIYTHQTYYDLSTNSVIVSVDVNEWDFSVETTGSMQSIKLNPAKGYRVFKTTSTNITDEIILPEVPEWNFDDPSYDPTKMAFYGWKDNEVFVIGKKMGSPNPTMPSIGVYAKVSFLKTSDGVKMQWMFEGETDIHHCILSVSGENHPFTWFSFEAEGAANIQPPSPNDYDLIFSSYTGEIFDGTQSFIFDLHGTLTNRAGNVRSYRYNPGDATDEEYIKIFKNLTASDVESSKFKIDANIIGYNWKTFSRITMSYEIDKSNMYFATDGDGNIFKIRFTNYYNGDGEKGYISFTYALL